MSERIFNIGDQIKLKSGSMVLTKKNGQKQLTEDGKEIKVYQGKVFDYRKTHFIGNSVDDFDGEHNLNVIVVWDDDPYHRNHEIHQDKIELA